VNERAGANSMLDGRAPDDPEKRDGLGRFAFVSIGGGMSDERRRLLGAVVEWFESERSGPNSMLDDTRPPPNEDEEKCERFARLADCGSAAE